MINNLIRFTYRLIRSYFLQRLIPKSNKRFEFSKDMTIEVVGFFESYSGIGESARLCALSLKDSGFKVKCRSVESVFRKKAALEWSLDGFYKGDEAPAIRIFHLNPPMLPPAIFSIGFKKYKESYNIGYWAWELENIPAEWQAALRYVNAVMTPSTFTTNAIKKNTKKPVITVHHPVSYNLSEINAGIKNKLEINDSTFLISTIFSFGSALERKNPQSLITCFKKAFSNQEDVKLVLKSNSGSINDKSEIINLIDGDDRIVLIDESWARGDVLGLMNESDLYASFHRSEGFGLTIAESLALGTPVIVTNWSGNVDFCHSDNCYMVDFDLVPVQSKHAEFKDCRNLRWAVVKEEHTIDLLRQAFRGQAIKNITKEPVQVKTIINNDVYNVGLKKIENFSLD